MPMLVPVFYLLNIIVHRDYTIIISFQKVFCTDCSQLVLSVMAHRGLNPQTCDVHCGFDGGQSMLKLAVTITDRLEGEKSGRSLYSDVSLYIYTV